MEEISMSNTNERKKNQFVERYSKLKAAENLILDTIKMFETIKVEEDPSKIIENFLVISSNHDVNAENLNEVKQILHQFISNELSHQETLACLNYTYDVTTFKAAHLWFIQDIFKCYW